MPFNISIIFGDKDVKEETIGDTISIEGIGCGSTIPFIGGVDWTLSFEERGDWELELDKPFDPSNDDGIVLSINLVDGTEADITNRRDRSKV